MENRHDPLTEDQKHFIKQLCEEFIKYNHIPAENYDKFNVKRGLRNSDGTGVIAGLTLISNVHGYVLSEGEKQPIDGILTYRGIKVEQIVQNCYSENRFGFEETIWLLLFGRLPNKKQLDRFTSVLSEFRSLPSGFTEDMILKAPSSNVMNKMARSVLALYSYDEYADNMSLLNILRQSILLISRMPVITAQAYNVKRHYYDNDSLYFHIPDKKQSTAECILSMIRPDRKFTEEEAKLLDICLVLHAEHGGGNNSTFATRVLSSSETDTYSAIAAGIGSLKGFKHGGANIKVLNQLNNMKEKLSNWEDEDEVLAFLEKQVRGEEFDNAGLIYGIGHAVYTKSDPRVGVLKEHAFKLAKGTEYEKEFNLLDAVERLAPTAFYNVKKSTKVISANVDLYSGLVYKLLGIPEDLFTPLFAVARVVGWCAHRIEEKVTGGRIIRPGYKSLAKEREYVSMDERI